MNVLNWRLPKQGVPIPEKVCPQTLQLGLSAQVSPSSKQTKCQRPPPPRPHIPSQKTFSSSGRESSCESSVHYCLSPSLELVYKYMGSFLYYRTTYYIVQGCVHKWHLFKSYMPNVYYIWLNTYHKIFAHWCDNSTGHKDISPIMPWMSLVSF